MDAPPENSVDPLAQLTLRSLFQPVVALATGEVVGHEAFIRGPAGSPWESPLALLKLASEHDRLVPFEHHCCQLHLAAFLDRSFKGKLLVNLGAEAIVEAHRRGGFSFFVDAGLPPHRLVVEITELARVDNPSALARALLDLRKLGMSFALDDYGEGDSSLRLWVELRPEIVKGEVCQPNRGVRGWGLQGCLLPVVRMDRRGMRGLFADMADLCRPLWTSRDPWNPPRFIGATRA